MPGNRAAAAPNEIWAIDFVSDRTADERPIEILTVTDARAPKIIRCDNGPEFISQALRGSTDNPTRLS